MPNYCTPDDAEPSTPARRWDDGEFRLTPEMLALSDHIGRGTYTDEERRTT